MKTFILHGAIKHNVVDHIADRPPIFYVNILNQTSKPTELKHHNDTKIKKSLMNVVVYTASAYASKVVLLNE